MKISVITVTWNSAATIGDTLASVSFESHHDVEHVIVDGGSTDATLAIVKEVGRRVSAIISERDNGIYDAMNKGLKLARGDVVGLLNSDDFLASSDVLSRVAQAFADPAVDVVYGDLCYVKQYETSEDHPVLAIRPVSLGRVRARLGTAAPDALCATRGY